MPSSVFHSYNLKNDGRAESKRSCPLYSGPRNGKRFFRQRAYGVLLFGKQKNLRMINSRRFFCSITAVEALSVRKVPQNDFLSKLIIKFVERCSPVSYAVFGVYFRIGVLCSFFKVRNPL